jgi:hydroxypyruvate isomerase
MALIDDLSHPNLFLQYDVYHAHVMGEDVLASLPARLPFIAHLQIADFPGRHQPGSGVIPFAELFCRLAASDYAGWVGCEYRPLGETVESLAWTVAPGGLPALR